MEVDSFSKHRGGGKSLTREEQRNFKVVLLLAVPEQFLF